MARGALQSWREEKEICTGSSIDRIKLSGYLKKKRNKVGGWRKLWFVLHDRLLVSYASKEEYDNTLASFKDVLNLLPGTKILPLDLYRFMIETTTQVIYTFHCDDQMAYREWIAMLLESAGSALNSTRNFHYFSSRDAIPNTHLKIKCPELPTVAEHNNLGLQKWYDLCFSEYTELCNKLVGEEPYKCMNNSQTLKNRIERMSISGSEKYRLLAITPCLEEYRSSVMVTTTTTENTLVQSSKPKADSKANSEPVYAVVDLQNKYDQRKKRSMMMEEKRCSSYESICRFGENKMNGKKKSLDSLADAVYEDGDIFCNRSIAEENIYEPINVSQKTSKFEFRKYISRLKLNSLLRSTPSHKLKSNFLEVKLPSANGAMSRFSTLRCKLGKHRKSVQRRMRNIYSNGYEPNSLFPYHEEASPSDIIDRPVIIGPDELKDSNEKTFGETRNFSVEKTGQSEGSTPKSDSPPAFLA